MNQHNPTSSAPAELAPTGSVKVEEEEKSDEEAEWHGKISETLRKLAAFHEGKQHSKRKQEQNHPNQNGQVEDDLNEMSPPLKMQKEDVLIDLTED